MKLFLRCFAACLPLYLLVIVMFAYPYMVESDAGSIDAPFEKPEAVPENQEIDDDQPEWYIEMLA